jgi:hypothetical protein
VVGLRITEAITGGFTVSVTVTDMPFRLAVIVATDCVATETVLTVNVAVFAPAATSTELGTFAAELLLESLTEMPPVGAMPVSVTVPVEDVSPTTVVGLRLTELRLGGSMVRVAL